MLMCTPFFLQELYIKKVMLVHGIQSAIISEGSVKKQIFGRKMRGLKGRGRVIFLVAVMIFVLILGAEGAGECGKTPIGSAAASLSPCLSAVSNVKAKVPLACCTRVGALLRTAPRCLCAVLLSPLAKQAKINVATAITIPKRCNIKNRPAGKKCGKYTLP